MHIAILGCGYVGGALAKLWSTKGHFVTCTTRNHNNLTHLDPICQKAVVVHTSDESELDLIIKENDLLVITVSADHEDDYKNAYLKTAEAIRHAAKKEKKPKKLFYTSSTAVYGEHRGKWVDENSPLLPRSDQSKILIETENCYRSLNELGWKVGIFRLAQIYGPHRGLVERVKRLQNHVIPATGESYTNMIHLDDIVGFIDYALNHNLFGTYNLADDDHSKRKDLYHEIAKQKGLTPVRFDPNLKGVYGGNKRISNHAIKAAGYTLKYPHREIS